MGSHNVCQLIGSNIEYTQIWRCDEASRMQCKQLLLQKTVNKFLSLPLNKRVVFPPLEGIYKTPQHELMLNWMYLCACGFNDMCPVCPSQ